MLTRATSFARPPKWPVFIELFVSFSLASCPLFADPGSSDPGGGQADVLPRLEYRAAPGCPTEAEFRRLLREELERNAEHGVDARTFRVAIQKSALGFRGELLIFSAEEVSERSFEGKICSEAAQALALALIFSLDPDALPPKSQSSPAAPEKAPGASSEPTRAPPMPAPDEKSSAPLSFGGALVGGATGLFGSVLLPYAGISGYLDYTWAPSRVTTLRLELTYASYQTPDLSLQALPAFTVECVPVGVRFDESWMLGLGPSLGAVRVESEAKANLVSRSPAVRTLPKLGAVGRLRFTPGGQGKIRWFGSVSAEGFSVLSGVEYLAADTQDRSLLRVEPGLNFRGGLELGALWSP